MPLSQLTPTDHLVIQLIRPADMPVIDRTLTPSVVRILWPPHPSEIPVQVFGGAAAMLTRLFATASTELARINAQVMYL